MIKKVVNRIKNKLVAEDLFPENAQLLDLFGDRAKGYLLGTSIAINNFDLTNLEEDALKITMGNFYEHPEIKKINPSIHLFAASHPPITETVLRNWWGRCDTVLPKGIPVMVAHTDKEIAEAVFSYREVYYYSYGGEFPIDFCNQIISPWSVSVLGVQLALYLRSKNTYMLGIDHDWRHKAPYRHFYTHEEPCLEYYLFQEGLFKKGLKTPTKVNMPPKSSLYKFYELYQQHETLNSYAEQLGLNVFNGDLNSIFDVYGRKEYTN